MTRQFLKDSLGWGFALWLIGYTLGMVLFAVVPQVVIGWIIMPIGIAVTLWVLLQRIKGTSLSYYVMLSVVWTVIAVLFDYIFIVKMLKPRDGYYKLDVYLYYALTFVLPVSVGWYKTD